jgi:hypothetical protein
MPNLSSENMSRGLLDLDFKRPHDDTVVMEEKNSNTVQLSLRVMEHPSLLAFYMANPRLTPAPMPTRSVGSYGDEEEYETDVETEVESDNRDQFPLTRSFASNFPQLNDGVVYPTARLTRAVTEVADHSDLLQLRDLTHDMPDVVPRLTRSVAGINIPSSLPGDNRYQ